MPIIEFDNAAFSYDGEHNALREISLSIEPGTFVCVLGGNGSGKSTFAKHINALLVPDDGRVSVLGFDTSSPENTFAVRSNAGMVFQNPDDQIVSSVIENDVAFGPENLGVPSDELRERVTRALEQVGLRGYEKKQTDTLSGGQKQRVAMAGVLAMEPQILILDEASAMLDPRGRSGLLRICKELNDAGLTIVMITHFMEEASFADRVIVLEKGNVVLDGAPESVLLQADRLAELSLDIPFATRLSITLREKGVPVALHANEFDLEDEIVRLLGNSDTAMPANPAGRKMAPRAEKTYGAENETPAIEFKNVSFTYEPVSQERKRKSSVAPEGKQADWGRAPSEYWALQDLSFSVHRGEFFGIAGHTGSGKSTLIQLANGLLKPNAGTVFAAGTPLDNKRAIADARVDVGVVFQYPEHQLFASTVFDDVAFGPRNLGLSNNEIEERVRHAMEMVHLDLDELRDRNPFELSGGQQRRVAFAGVLAMDPHTLMLDEPVAGLDPQAKQRFLDLLVELREQQGLTVVVVSHNMDDLAKLCDRVLVLNEGRLFALDTPAAVFTDEAVLNSIGLGVPQAAHLANSLATYGVELPVDTVPSIDDLASAIALVAASQSQEGR